MAWQLDFRRRHDDLTRTREVCDNSYTASTLGRELATKIHIVYIDAVGSCTTCHPTRTWNLHIMSHQAQFSSIKITLPSVNGRLVCCEKRKPCFSVHLDIEAKVYEVRIGQTMN